jgi:hypothetical protein
MVNQDPREVLARLNVAAVEPQAEFGASGLPAEPVRFSGLLCAKSDVAIFLQRANTIFEIPVDGIATISESGEQVMGQEGPNVTVEVRDRTKIGVRRTITVTSAAVKPLMLSLGSSAGDYAVPQEEVDLRNKRRSESLGLSADGEDLRGSATDSQCQGEKDTTWSTAAGTTTWETHTTVYDSQGKPHDKISTDSSQDTTTDKQKDSYTYVCDIWHDDD